MVPKINNQGHSFKGIIAYLMHDKKSLETSERVRWYETGNMLTDDPEKAAKIMAWTDLSADHLKEQSGGSKAGRKTEKGAVYHFSLAWHGDEKPDAKHQQEYALETLKKLNLQDHQYVLVAHNDTDHDHVHVVVNLTHPENGIRADLKFDKRKMQELALEYEKEHGIYCENRFKNEREREKARLTNQVTRAYELSDNGKSFKAALEAEGLILAAGRNNNRIVFIDKTGKIQNVSRFLKTDEKSPTQALKARFADLDISTLPEADRKAEEIKAQYEQPHKTPKEIKQDFKTAAKGQAVEPAQKQPSTPKAPSAEEEGRRKGDNLKSYIERIQEQTAKSREKWNIDALKKARDEAKAGHGYRREAALKKAEAALQEGQEQFRSEILTFNKNRPKWAIGKELEQQGLSPVVTEKELDYMRQVEEAQKRERAEATLKAKYFDDIFDKKAAKSRNEWGIDALTKERDDARRALDKAKVFHADDEKRQAAEKDLKKAQNHLDNHQGWLRDDIVLMNRNRAPWAVQKELEKHGFAVDDIDASIAQAHERAERLRKKQGAYYSEKRGFEERERVRALNRQIRMETEKSRKHWGIDKAISDKEAAQQSFAKYNGIRGVVTGKKRQIAEGLDVATRTHQDRMHHFQNEIRWFNRMKPEAEIQEALKAQGIEQDYYLPHIDRRTPAEIEADAIRQRAEKKQQIKTEKEAKAKERLLSKQQKEAQKDRERQNSLAVMAAQSQRTIAVPEPEEGREKLIKTAVTIEKPKQVIITQERGEFKTQRLAREQSQSFDLSLEDRAKALQAARRGELGQKYQEMARGEFDAEKRLEIRKAWIEAQGVAMNDNEPSIQKEQDQEIEL